MVLPGDRVKSDKINILRKQYDAFLEEDKKRKERNEFILGRLEDMRFSTKVSVPIHDQKVQLREDYYTFPQRSYLSKPEFGDYKHLREGQSIPFSTYNKNFEETSVFKEISKKYILIPKLQSLFQSGAMFADSPMKNITDTDWKNKYHILDELKKNEKDTTIDNDNKITDFHKDNNNMLQIDVPLSTMHNENLSLNNREKEHKKHQNENKISLNISPENLLIIQNNAEHIKYPIDNIKDSELNLETCEKGNKLHQEMCDYKEHSNESNLIENTVVKLHPTTNDKDRTIEMKETKDYLQEKDQHNISVKKIKEAPIMIGDENLNTYKHTNSLVNFEANEKTKENVDVGEINQDLNNSNNGITLLSQEEDEQQECKETIVNDTEIYKADENQFDNRELYEGDIAMVVYGEDHEGHTNRKENYENNHINNEHVIYATENDDYINEKNQISNEARNENDENEEYTYYDESHQEPYTSEINEHEESSERYDPNYEQQYANNYEGPNMGQYQNQQYEVENTYEQDTNNVVHDNQNVSNIDITDQPQQENIYNYEDDINVNQQYNSNVQQEYSVIQNDQYGYQQETNESEVIENVLDAESGLAEQVTEGVNETVKTVKNTEKPSGNIQPDIALK